MELPPSHMYAMSMPSLLAIRTIIDDAAYPVERRLSAKCQPAAITKDVTLELLKVHSAALYFHQLPDRTNLDGRRDGKTVSPSTNPHICAQTRDAGIRLHAATRVFKSLIFRFLSWFFFITTKDKNILAVCHDHPISLPNHNKWSPLSCSTST